MSNLESEQENAVKRIVGIATPAPSASTSQ
jgi:hypothetical protein